MRVTIHGPNLNHGHQLKGTLHVHQSDCADNARYAYCEDESGPGWTIEAETRGAVVEDIYPPEDFNYDPFTDERAAYDDDVWFAPCCRNLPMFRRPTREIA